MADRRDVMDMIHGAADRPRYRPRHDWSFDAMFAFASDDAVNAFDAIWGGLRGAHFAHLIRLIRAESYVLAKEGRFADAIANQARCLRLAAHAAATPTIVASLRAGACEGLALDGMLDILYLAGPNADVADRVRQAVVWNGPHYSLRRALEGELLLNLTMTRKIRSDPAGQVGYIRSDSPRGAQKLKPKDRRFWENLWDAVEAEQIRQMRRAIALLRKPLPHRVLAAEFGDRFQREFGSPNHHPVRLLVGDIASVFAGFATLPLRSQSRVDRLLAGAAVLAYRARQGAFPDRLEQAMTSPSVDPSSGRPLHYRRVGDGFIIARTGSEAEAVAGAWGWRMNHRATYYFRYPPPPPTRPEHLPANEGARPGSPDGGPKAP